MGVLVVSSGGNGSSLSEGLLAAPSTHPPTPPIPPSPGLDWGLGCAPWWIAACCSAAAAPKPLQAVLNVASPTCRARQVREGPGRGAQTGGRLVQLFSPAGSGRGARRRGSN